MPSTAVPAMILNKCCHSDIRERFEVFPFEESILPQSMRAIDIADDGCVESVICIRVANSVPTYFVNDVFEMYHVCVSPPPNLNPKNHVLPS